MNTNRGSHVLGTALGSALVLTLCVNAHAADIYQAPPEPAVEMAPAPVLDRGIYIKGYLGQANPDVGSMTNEIYATNPTFHIFHDDIKSSPLFGVGVGWKHSHWLRFDVTGEYRGDALFVGHDSYFSATGFPNPNGGTNEYTADIQSWLGLANAYIDMGNWCGFTPYVGAGIGFATISVNGLKDVNVPQASTFYGADHTNTNFAWALYAGTSYDVTPQITLDLTYRYAQLGNAQSGRVAAFDNGNNAYSGQFIKDITSNDLLLGFRYKFQQAVPVYAVK
jgi:opacity protein-like surface antigen